MNTTEPIACTLGTDALNARLDRIAELARQHLLTQRKEGGALHLLYAGAAALELKEIVSVEQECCACLKFELAERAKVIELTIRAPTEASELAGMLFQHFSASAEAAVAPRCSAACSC